MKAPYFLIFIVLLAFAGCGKTPVSKGEKALLSVDSNPSNASVYWDSELLGKTPLQNASVSSGTAQLKLTKEGYRPEAKEIHLAPNGDQSETITLHPLPFGEVMISSIPPRADVIFNGELIAAKTPVSIRKVPSEKTHVIQLKLEGYNDWEKSFTMEGDSKTFAVDLVKK